MTFDEALTQINEQASFISVKNIWQKLRLRVLLRQYGITPSWMDHSWIVYDHISAEDRHVLECIVQGEAGDESLEGKKNLCLIYFYATNDYRFISTSSQALEKMGFWEIPFDSISNTPIDFDYYKLL